jgi:hypothetical protein
MKPEDINKFSSLVKRGVFSFQFTHIELLLAQQDILKNADNEDIVLLVQKASSVYHAKSEAFDQYSYYGIATSCLILSRTLVVKKDREFASLSSELPELMSYNNRGISVNKALLNRVVLEATSLFIK